MKYSTKKRLLNTKHFTEYHQVR